MNTPQDIIDYWFSENRRSSWFASNSALDRQIRQDYQTLWQTAQQDDLNEWQNTAVGCLALIIVLDQFPLNMFRGLAKSFSTEAQAIRICKLAIQQKFDQQLPTEQLGFLYMPLMHSEQIADQDRCVELMTQAGLQQNQQFAQHHRDIIRRFDRFPHRNRVLGRPSSPAELAWLASDQAFDPN